LEKSYGEKRGLSKKKISNKEKRKIWSARSELFMNWKIKRNMRDEYRQEIDWEEINEIKEGG
jgi:hypothetical protein